ncbi:sigma-54 interaction domain protein, partial [Vibrio parahaemolyticus V-223/04]
VHPCQMTLQKPSCLVMRQVRSITNKATKVFLNRQMAVRYFLMKLVR